MLLPPLQILLVSARGVDRFAQVTGWCRSGHMIYTTRQNTIWNIEANQCYTLRKFYSTEIRVLEKQVVSTSV